MNPFLFLYFLSFFVIPFFSKYKTPKFLCKPDEHGRLPNMCQKISKFWSFLSLFFRNSLFSLITCFLKQNWKLKTSTEINEKDTFVNFNLDEQVSWRKSKAWFIILHECLFCFIVLFCYVYCLVICRRGISLSHMCFTITNNNNEKTLKVLDWTWIWWLENHVMIIIVFLTFKLDI